MTDPRWTTAQHKVVGAETDLLALLSEAFPRMSGNRRDQIIAAISALITAHIEAELTAQKRLEAYEAKQALVPEIIPFDDFGDVIAIEDFDIKFFSEDDGTGYYATSEGKSNIYINYYELQYKTYDRQWTHVAWYNK